MTTKKLTPAQLLDLPLLTIEQAAQLLQCSPEHLRRQARARNTARTRHRVRRVSSAH